MQNVIRWICRLWALLNILTLLALCLVADGHGGSILRAAAGMGAIFLGACAFGVGVLSYIPAKYTGKPAARVNTATPVRDKVKLPCVSCLDKPSVCSCVTHGIPVCEPCARRHEARGCEIGYLSIVPVAPANQRGSDAE
jgi:hypothetical protein